jgi:hypothetical protein
VREHFLLRAIALLARVPLIIFNIFFVSRLSHGRFLFRFSKLARVRPIELFSIYFQRRISRATSAVIWNTRDEDFNKTRQHLTPQQ